MIFLAEPGLMVTDTHVKPNKIYFFDENGEIEITDEAVAKRFAVHFMIKDKSKKKTKTSKKDRVCELYPSRQHEL